MVTYVTSKHRCKKCVKKMANLFCWTLVCCVTNVSFDTPLVCCWNACYITQVSSTHSRGSGVRTNSASIETKHRIMIKHIKWLWCWWNGLCRFHIERTGLLWISIHRTSSWLTVMYMWAQDAAPIWFLLFVYVHIMCSAILPTVEVQTAWSTVWITDNLHLINRC